MRRKRGIKKQQAKREEKRARRKTEKKKQQAKREEKRARRKRRKHKNKNKNNEKEKKGVCPLLLHFVLVCSSFGIFGG
jgi:hypothetical protein